MIGRTDQRTDAGENKKQSKNKVEKDIVKKASFYRENSSQRFKGGQNLRDSQRSVHRLE